MFGMLIPAEAEAYRQRMQHARRMDISAEAHRLQNMRFGPPYDYGRDFRDAPALLVGPAAIAKHRLRQVIAADRKAVPAYRWVRSYALGDSLDPIHCMTELLALWPRYYKPHYRWERRR